MHSFTDADNRAWLVTVNVQQIRRVRALLKIDLFKLPGDGFKPLQDLLSDPCALVDVLYVLCEEEAKERGISDEEFGRLMAGDVLENAAEAFLSALTDFFPSRQREALQKVIEKGRQVHLLATGKAVKALDEVDPEAVLRTLSASAGNSRASSASTPPP